jgi:hypothetical protein
MFVIFGCATNKDKNGAESLHLFRGKIEIE